MGAFHVNAHGPIGAAAKAQQSTVNYHIGKKIHLRDGTNLLDGYGRGPKVRSWR
jgi:hypothetical protein